MDVNYNKNCFLNIVNNKFKKYSNQTLDFDKFIVLCLANEIEIINEYDVESFFDLIDKTTKRNITIGILYFNNYMDVFCYDERNF